MQHLRYSDILPFDPEIKRLFRWRHKQEKMLMIEPETVVQLA